MRRIAVMIIAGNPFYRSGLRHTLSQRDRLSKLEIKECDPGEKGEEAVENADCR